MSLGKVTVVASMLLATPASQNPFEGGAQVYATMGSWVVYSNPGNGFAFCNAENFYDNGDVLSIGMAAGSTGAKSILCLHNPKWTVTPQKTIGAVVEIDGKDTQIIEVQGLSEGNGYCANLDPARKLDFYNGNVLTIIFGSNTKSYRLDGSKAALTAVMNCLLRQLQ